MLLLSMLQITEALFDRKNAGSAIVRFNIIHGNVAIYFVFSIFSLSPRSDNTADVAHALEQCV